MLSMSGMSWTSRLMLIVMVGMGLYMLAGWIGGLGSWLQIFAVILLLLTALVLLHERRMLGSVSHIPVLGRLLEWFISGDGTHCKAPRRLGSKERAKRTKTGQRILCSFVGGEYYEQLILEDIVEPLTRVSSDLPICAVITGPPGVGKRAAADALTKLMIGASIVSAETVQLVGKKDLETSATISGGEALAAEAIDGILLLENLDAWIDERGAADLFEGLVVGARRGDRRAAIVITCSKAAANRLKNDPALQTSARRLDLRRVDFPALTDAALVKILERELNVEAYSLDSDLHQELMRLVRDVREELGENFLYARTVRDRLAVDLRRASGDDRRIHAETVDRVRRERRRPG